MLLGIRGLHYDAADDGKHLTVDLVVYSETDKDHWWMGSVLLPLDEGWSRAVGDIAADYMARMTGLDIRYPRFRGAEDNE